MARHQSTRGGVKVVLLAAFLALASPAFAQIVPSATPEADAVAFAKVRERMDSIRQYRPTVGLVLAGGGARGMAHLGVIRYLEELGIPVDVVTGTSIGALVGGIYSLGYDHRQLDSLARNINWAVMMSDKIPDAYLSYSSKRFRDRFLIRVPFHYDDKDLAQRIEKEKFAERMAGESGTGTADVLQETISRMGIGMPDGFLYGLNVRNLLSSVSVGYQDSISFASLPIPFACVATDVYAQKPKYWTGGKLPTAMRSSMAIPLYFRTVREDGAILLDGCMQNNVPADIAKAMGADIIIASTMTEPVERDQINTPVDILFQGFGLLSSSTDNAALELANLCVNHPLEGYSQLSFDEESISEIIRQGYENALVKKEEFGALAAAVAGKPAPGVHQAGHAINIAQHKVLVDKVVFLGIEDSEREKILHKSAYPSDNKYDKQTIERLLNSIYGTNAFEAISYYLQGSAEPYTLVFDCQKGQVNDFAAGIHADTDETVYASLHLGLGTRRLAGPRLVTDLKLGLNPYLAVDASYRFKIGLPTVGLALGSRRMKTASGYMSDTEHELLSTFMDLYVQDSRLTFGSMRAGLSYEMNPYERYLTQNEFRSGWVWNSYWMSAFASLKSNTFNDGYFPTKGLRASLDGRYVLSPKSYASVSAALEGAWTPVEGFSILPSVFLGWYSADKATMNPRHVVSAGGFLRNRYVEHQLPFFGFHSGFRNCRPISGVAQLDLRYNFARVNYVTIRGGLFQDDNTLEDFFRSNPVYAFGVEFGRQSIVGPIKLAASWCNIINGISAYLSVGFDF